MPINPGAHKGSGGTQCAADQSSLQIWKLMSYIKFAFFFFYIYLKSSWLERLPWFFKANIVPTWLHISNHTLVIKCVIKSWRLHNWAYDVPRRSGSSFTTSVSAAVKRRVPSGHDGLEKVHNVLKQSRGKKKIWLGWGQVWKWRVKSPKAEEV